uniref:hypothetical protein n=1 Tax=Alloprevotella sp. TaxID=1872471 RepID=UPI00402825AE
MFFLSFSGPQYLNINAKVVRCVTIGASEEEGAIAQEPAENMPDIVYKFCYRW